MNRRLTPLSRVPAPRLPRSKGLARAGVGRGTKSQRWGAACAALGPAGDREGPGGGGGPRAARPRARTLECSRKPGGKKSREGAPGRRKRGVDRRRLVASSPGAQASGAELGAPGGLPGGGGEHRPAEHPAARPKTRPGLRRWPPNTCCGSAGVDAGAVPDGGAAGVDAGAVPVALGGGR